MIRLVTKTAMPALGLALLFCVWGLPAFADFQGEARVAIVIDDLGVSRSQGQRALRLPGKITYAFLPFTKHGPSQAEQAYQTGRQVMLHLPMESMIEKPLGPLGLRMDMTHVRVRQNIRAALASVPYAVGVNNHMGSLLTRHPGYMQWVMEEIKAAGNLYFIDSRTTHHTVAELIAVENAVPVRRRDVFLDSDRSLEAIRYQFLRLVTKAKKEGSAIGIGHPYDNTLMVLEEMIPQLAVMGVKLVLASELIPAFDSSPAVRQHLAAVPEDKRDVHLPEPIMIDFNGMGEVGTPSAM